MELRKNLSHAPSIVLGVLAVGVGLWASISPAKLPEHTLPPSGWGRTNPDVTQTNIDQNICNPKWRTSSIRPSNSLTTSLKIAQLNFDMGYRVEQPTLPLDSQGNPDITKCVQGSLNKACYEEDHLISLELGGAPSDSLNLWPEPYTNPVDNQNLGAREKDKVEGYLHGRVCSKAETLSSAQHRISTNWVEVYAEMKGVKYTGGQSDTDD